MTSPLYELALPPRRAFKDLEPYYRACLDEVLHAGTFDGFEAKGTQSTETILRGGVVR